MELRTAVKVAEEVVKQLEPYCQKICVVGSIRRQKPIVRDIDIVVIPKNQGRLALALTTLGKKIKSGPAIHSCWYYSSTYTQVVQVDIYIANETTWPTLLLIRTGSKEYNIKLCRRAHDLVMILHADGSGLELPAGRYVPKSEEDIFEKLKLPYVPPEGRN